MEMGCGSLSSDVCEMGALRDGIVFLFLSALDMSLLGGWAQAGSMAINW